MRQARAARLVARVYDTNAASIRIVHKLGMAYETTLETNDIGSVHLIGAAKAPRD